MRSSESNNISKKWNPLEAMPAGHEFEAYHLFDMQYAQTVTHSHAYYEFYMFVKGDIRLMIEDHEYQVEPYDFFLFPPGFMHRNITHNIQQEYERAYFYLSENCLQSMDTEDCRLSNMIHDMVKARHFHVHLGKETCTAIIHRMDHIIETADSLDPLDQRINHARMVILVASLCSAIRHESVETTKEDGSIPSRVMRYINQHLTEDISLDNLAEQMFVSKYYMLHAFKEKTGTSVHQYLIMKRIVYAEMLMQNGMSPSEAAHESGFEDYTVFYRAFKNRTGRSPLEYIKLLGIRTGD